MDLAFNDRVTDNLGLVLKALIALGIVMVTTALILILGDYVYRLTGRWETQLLVTGTSILVMAYLSYKIYVGLGDA